MYQKSRVKKSIKRDYLFTKKTLDPPQLVVDIGFNICLLPFSTERQEFGRPKPHHEGSLLLPCGKCTECISKRAFEWATRCRHEISLHKENCFLTLTYNEENLPSHLIVKEDFQKFMKKLRKKCKRPLRYIVSHEYGSNYGRPHHHTIIFGYNPPNQSPFKRSPSGDQLYISQEIEKLWDKGFHSIGTANEKTAYYIASYSLKSSTRDVTDNFGEVSPVRDSMDASKRPAIGLNFLLNNLKQLSSSKQPIPRYYQKVLERDYPDLFENYQNIQCQENMKKTQKSDHQKLAKFIISEQKKENPSYLRINDSSQIRFTSLKHHFKQNIHNFVETSKRIKNEHF